MKAEPARRAVSAATYLPSCRRCGSADMTSEQARLVCRNCGLVGGMDPQRDDDRRRFVDGSDTLENDGVQAMDPLHRGSAIGFGASRSGDKLRRQQGAANAKGSAKALRQTESKLSSHPKRNLQLTRCASLLTSFIDALPLSSDVKTAARDLCAGELPGVLGKLHRKTVPVGVAAVLWIAMRYCHKPECVAAIVLLVRMVPPAKHRVVYDSRFPMGKLLPLERGAVGGKEEEEGVEEGDSAGERVAGARARFSEEMLSNNAVHRMLRSLNKVRPSKSPLDSDLVPRPPAGREMPEEVYVALVAKARRAHDVFYNGLWMPARQLAEDLLCHIVVVPASGPVIRTRVRAALLAAHASLSGVMCGHNPDHRCGVMAYLCMREFMGLLPNVAIHMVARRCATRVKTIVRTADGLIASTDAATVANLARARAAFLAALCG